MGGDWQNNRVLWRPFLFIFRLLWAAIVANPTQHSQHSPESSQLLANSLAVRACFVYFCQIDNSRLQSLKQIARSERTSSCSTFSLEEGRQQDEAQEEERSCQFSEARFTSASWFASGTFCKLRTFFKSRASICLRTFIKSRTVYKPRIASSNSPPPSSDTTTSVPPSSDGSGLSDLSIAGPLVQLTVCPLLGLSVLSVTLRVLVKLLFNGTFRPIIQIRIGLLQALLMQLLQRRLLNWPLPELTRRGRELPRKKQGRL